MNKVNIFQQDLQQNILKEQIHFPERFMASLRSLTDENYKIITGNGFCSNVGINVDFGVGINVDINNTGNNFDLGTTAVQLSVVSSDANDTLLSTGARVIFLEGLDENNDEISEAIFLNGTSPVLSANSYLRLNNATVLSSGSTNSPQGTITISANGFNWALLEPLQKSALLGRYSIPRDWTFIGETINVSADNSTEYFFQIIAKTPSTSEIEVLRGLVYQNTGSINGIPASTQGPADLVVRLTKLGGSGVEKGSAYFSGYLVKNSVINEWSKKL